MQVRRVEADMDGTGVSAKSINVVSVEGVSVGMRCMDEVSIGREARIEG